ncbi:MAG: SPOR domain-containing protein [Rubrivivax sp.]|nr:SPOR domain-containing protein [Rubrivivax sp.]
MAFEDPVVAQARTQARRRLIGAVVLLVAAVVAFPLVFDTQPRPLPREVAVLAPHASAPVSALPAPVKPAPAPEDAGIESGRPSDARPASAAAALPSASTAAATRPADPALKPTASAVPAPVAARASAPAVVAATPAPTPAARASEPSAVRFVVQAGAYTEAAALRSARQKVEALGLKTYTQEVASAEGKRTRVRVGPFASRDEAEAAAKRIQRAGLQANVLAI